MSDQQVVKVLPVLPLKNALLFPNLLMPLSVGRSSSLAAVKAALATEDKEIILVAQRDPEVESPQQTDLYSVGTRAVIRRMSQANESMVEVLVMGVERVTVLKVEEGRGYLQARVLASALPQDGGAEVEALHGALIELANKAIELAQVQAPPEIRSMLLSNDDPLRLVFLLASVLSLDVHKEQALLEAPTRVDALRLMHSYLS